MKGRAVSRVVLAACLVGCKAPEDETDTPPPADEVGLVGDHVLNPFPVGALHTADGHLALDPADWELTTQTPLAADRVNWRTGFSPAQTAVLALPAFDTTDFPHWREDSTGQGSVRLVDLTDGVWLPAFAELDAHPDAEPTLLVRPQIALPYGHDIAVVVTTDATERVDRFTRLLSDDPPEDLAPHAAHFREVVDAIGTLGLPEDQIAIAWDFPVGDGTAPLRSVWAQTALPDTWQFDDVRTSDTGGIDGPNTYKIAVGSYTATDFLIDDLAFDLQPDGTVVPTGTTEALLYVQIPESVADAPAGSVPVLLMGHGIFREPADYLDEASDDDGVNYLVNDAGFIVVATVWRGLSYPDRVAAIEAAGDFAKIYNVTDRLSQGQGNVAELIRLMTEGDLFADPVFEGRQGQNLVDTEHIRYYGISLGGIEGAVMLANDPPLDAAVLHVGGSAWSTMLERSSNWLAFELFLENTVPDPLLRQRLYAASQLYWDPADPISWTTELSQRDFLLQEAIGDEQVPNMTTRMLARSVGLPQLQPVVDTVWGLDPISAPQPPGSRGYVEFDTEQDLPPETNRPAPITDAHYLPRRWPTTNSQTRTFLTVGSEGEIVHPCGAEPCSLSNSGVE